MPLLPWSALTLVWSLLEECSAMTPFSHTSNYNRLFSVGNNSAWHGMALSEDVGLKMISLSNFITVTFTEAHNANDYKLLSNIYPYTNYIHTQLLTCLHRNQSVQNHNQRISSMYMYRNHNIALQHLNFCKTGMEATKKERHDAAFAHSQHTAQWF